MKELTIRKTKSVTLEYKGKYSGLRVNVRDGKVSSVVVLYNAHAGSSLSDNWQEQIVKGKFESIQDLKDAIDLIWLDIFGVLSDD